MPDNYKHELQNCAVGNRNIDEPICNNDIKEDNILLVKHFDEKFPITEEQLQAIKCFHCQNNKKMQGNISIRFRQIKTMAYKHLRQPLHNLYTTSPNIRLPDIA